MTVQEIAIQTAGRIVVGAHRKEEKIDCAFASDLMSDVLTINSSQTIMLITGLCNMQTIRTCEMSNIEIILFVRGKKVTEEMKELADENNMVLIENALSMYRTSGILFNLNLHPIY